MPLLRYNRREYYLKARFHLNKDQFADLMVISGIAETISQLLLMPILATAIGERRNCCQLAHFHLYSFKGKAQGCISDICSFANVVSPLAFTPLTALFLSERASFHFPGFSIMCIGFASMIVFA